VKQITELMLGHVTQAQLQTRHALALVENELEKELCREVLEKLEKIIARYAESDDDKP